MLSRLSRSSGRFQSLTARTPVSSVVTGSSLQETHVSPARVSAPVKALILRINILTNKFSHMAKIEVSRMEEVAEDAAGEDEEEAQ